MESVRKCKQARRSAPTHNDNDDISNMLSESPDSNNSAETLHAIVESLKDIKQCLNTHVQATTNSLSQIRDEIVSIKRQIKVSTNETRSDLKDAEMNSKILQDDCEKKSDMIIKRLQSVTDSVKSINETQTHVTY